MKVPRCSRCGRPLKSPESIARGIGPECAGLPPSRRQIAHSHRVARGRAYVNRKPVQIGETIFTYVRKEKSWKNEKSGTLTQDERFKDWMLKNEIAIMPEPCLKKSKRSVAECQL